MIVRLGAVAVLAAALAGGCKCREKTEPGEVQRGAPPAAAEVVAAYNARVEPLDRLWAATVSQIWVREEDGKERQEQVEGTLGWVRPRRVILTFTKVGELYGILGSNETLYWWIQLGKEKSAVWGEHAKVTEERTRKLGIPVQPLEVVELLGITALPGEGAAVEWSPDGRSLVVTTSRADGKRRVWMDPATHEPTRIELLDEAGEVVVHSELEQYRPVTGTNPPTRVAGVLQVRPADDRVRLRMVISEPERRMDKPKDAALDFKRLVDIYKIEDVRSVDEEPPG